MRVDFTEIDDFNDWLLDVEAVELITFYELLPYLCQLVLLQKFLNYSVTVELCGDGKFVWVTEDDIRNNFRTYEAALESGLVFILKA